MTGYERCLAAIQGGPLDRFLAFSAVTGHSQLTKTFCFDRPVRRALFVALRRLKRTNHKGESGNEK